MNISFYKKERSTLVKPFQLAWETIGGTFLCLHWLDDMDFSWPIFQYGDTFIRQTFSYCTCVTEGSCLYPYIISNASSAFGNISLYSIVNINNLSWTITFYVSQKFYILTHKIHRFRPVLWIVFSFPVDLLANSRLSECTLVTSLNMILFQIICITQFLFDG